MTAMGEVHQLILPEGVDEARRQAVTKHEPQMAEAAGLVLAEEVSRRRITHAGLAMTSLPHKHIRTVCLGRDPEARVDLEAAACASSISAGRAADRGQRIGLG